MAPDESLRKNAPNLKGESKRHYYISYSERKKHWSVWLKDTTALNPRHQRQYVGAYDTEYLALRGQDRAAMKWFPNAVAVLNFKESDYKEDEELREKLSNEQFRRLLMVDSRSVASNTEASPGWKKFLDEEKAEYKRPNGRSTNPNRPTTPFTEVLKKLMEVTVEHTTTSTKNCPVADNSHEDQGAMPSSSGQIPHILDSLAWKTKMKRSSVPFTRAANSSKAASSGDASDPDGNIGTVLENLASKETNGTSAIVARKQELSSKPRLLSLFPISYDYSEYIVEENQELGGEPTVGQNSWKRRRLDIDLNGPPHEVDVGWDFHNDWIRDSEDSEHSTWGTSLSLGADTSY